jgi:ribosomal-protein-alanine N-acetyltransferase
MASICIIPSASAMRFHKAAYILFCEHRNDAWQFANFEKSMLLPHSIIASIDDKCIGYALVTQVLDEVEIEDICVSSSYRRLGIADKLLKHVINQACVQNAMHVLLEVAKSNIQARALYKKNGFEVTGVRKAYYALPNNKFDDALLMRKDLT